MTTWLDDDDVTDIMPTDPAPNPYATGYGHKIPMQYKLRIGKRWHRLYAMCYSNSATYYVIKAGVTLILDTGTEHRIEKVRDGVGVPTPVRIDNIGDGNRFRFHHDGVVSTLWSARDGRYTWHDYQGTHHLFTGTYSFTGKHAWPYVYPTTDPETEVKP